MAGPQLSDRRGMRWSSVHGKVHLAGKQPQLIHAMTIGGRAMHLVGRHWKRGRGRRPSLQQADDPCRAIKIVTLTGQLYATISKRLIATACATQKVTVERGTNRSPRDCVWSLTRIRSGVDLTFVN